MLYRITTLNSTYEVEAFEGRPAGRVRRTRGPEGGLHLGEWLDVAVHGSGLGFAPGTYGFVFPSGEALVTSTIQRFERIAE